MYRYRLITCRYCSPMSVVISLRFDLVVSWPIPSRLHRYRSLANASMHLCLFDRITCVRENRTETRKLRSIWISFTRQIVSIRRSNSVFDSIRSAYPRSGLLRNEFTLFPFSCCVSLRSISSYFAHVQPVAYLHLHLKISVLVGPMRDGLQAYVPIATPLASRRSVFLAWEMMELMSRVAVHRQGRVGRLAAGRLVSGRKGRRRTMVSGYTVLKPRVVLRSFRGVVGVARWQMGRLRRAA